MALLAEAGYPDAFENAEIPLVVTSLAGNPEFAQMAELVQASFDAVGIRTEMCEQDWATGNTAIRGFTADFITPMRNAPVRPSALGVQIFFTRHASPHLDVGDPELNDLGGALIAETDPARPGPARCLAEPDVHPYLRHLRASADGDGSGLGRRVQRTGRGLDFPGRHLVGAGALPPDRSQVSSARRQ